MNLTRRIAEAVRYVRDDALVILDASDWVDDQLGRANDDTEHPGLSCAEAQELIDYYRERDRFIRGINDPEDDQ